MNLHLLAFSADFDHICRLVVQDEDHMLISILAKKDNWRLPSFKDARWYPFWVVHAAVNKQDFEWIVRPTFDKMGFVKNPFTIRRNEVLQAIDMLTLTYNRGLLPAGSAEEIYSLWKSEKTDTKTILSDYPFSSGFQGVLISNQLMRDLTYFKIGGFADLFAVPDNLDDLWTVIDFCTKNEVPFVVIGNGSKILFLDEGFGGVVVKLGRGFKKVEAHGEEVIAGAAVDLPVLIQFATERELAGLEFLATVPGTIGGAVVRNASAFGVPLSSKVLGVEVMDVSGRVNVLPARDIIFGYRTSGFLQKRDLVITKVMLRLSRDHNSKIIHRIRRATRRKMESQPLMSPSAGSVFKNPPSYPAGFLIERAGCVGMKVGDAEVSSQHANFIINKGEARARDVIQLVLKVREKVKEKIGIDLEPELDMISGGVKAKLDGNIEIEVPRFSAVFQ